MISNIIDGRKRFDEARKQAQKEKLSQLREVFVTELPLFSRADEAIMNYYLDFGKKT